MAKITVTLNGVVHYKDLTSTTPITEKIVLSTDKQEANVFFAVGEKVKTTCKYRLSISDFSMQKKMYEPTEIIVDLSITPSQGDSSDYQEIGRKQLEELFKHIRVGLSEGSFSIGDDFYVHEVIPSYQSKSMHVTLKIYSLDKLMTVKQASRTFVSKKLGEDILKAEVPKYITPWTIDPEVADLQKQIEKNLDKMGKLLKEIDKEKAAQEMTKEEQDEIETLRKTNPGEARKKSAEYSKRYLELSDDDLEKKRKECENLTTETSTLMTEKANKDAQQGRMSYNTTNMRFLYYWYDPQKGVNCEHIFPYLVQYNESFYDMLARTTNRWGEFLYYEDGTLNVGYDAKATAIPINRDLIKEISYCDLNAKPLSVATDGKYDYEADNSSLTGRPLQKSPAIVKAQMGDFGGKVDKWVMKQFATFFKNDKDLPTFATNWLIDNLFSLAMAESSVAKLNYDFDGKYFPDDKKPGREEQYGQWDFSKKTDSETKMLDGFQQFSEIGTEYNGKKYSTILAKEQTVGRDAICINFGTNNPQLKLGNIISFNGENFIVVEIAAGFDAKGNLTFHVTGTAQDKKDHIFYPAVIPAGHVRYASPQVATITDPNDPTSLNRARVMFSWQEVRYKDDDDKSKGATDDTIKNSTPWLNFASNQNGYPVMGYHYTGNQVMVGFEDGNVERPYIMGGLADDFLFADCALASPGMHQLTLTDGYGDGLTAFLGGILSPALKNFMAFCPKTLPKIDFKQNKYFEGGFELTDYYGTYKISGSTDGRNVSIASNWGDVKINAFTGINISAPNGDIKISGKNVTIEAGNNLSLVSGKNVNYKLIKSKDTGLGTLAQIMVDATAAVAKKILQVTIGGIIDFSYIRSIVEIIFRPVEGTLTVKSNRFLKLEAGNNSCKFPASAFNKEEKLKVLNAMNKKTIDESLGLGPGMVKVFEKISPLITYIFDNYQENYDKCIEKKKAFDEAVDVLKGFSHNGTDPKPSPCKTYKELMDELWSQKENTAWTEEKLEFTEDVAVTGNKAKMIPTKYVTTKYGIKANDDARLKMIEVGRDMVYKDRMKYRAECLEKLNDLREAIYKATHFELKRAKVSEVFGHVNPSGMPKDYKEKLLTALSKDKCPKALCYAGTSFDKTLDSDIRFSSLSNDEKEDRLKDSITYYRRVAAMNLLEEFGFKDDMRKKVGGDLTAVPIKLAELPPKPDTENPQSFSKGSIMHTRTWKNYVNSLNAIPPIGKDKSTIWAAFKDATAGMLKNKFYDGLDGGWNVLQSLQEKKTWGEGKKGQILFAADRKTYALQNKQFGEIEVLKPTLNGLEAKDENDAINGFLKEIKESLLKF